MTIAQVSAKMDLRLNKGASGDYDNLWAYQKQEAFHKAINSWTRRQKRGKNQTQEGDEESQTRVDDLQVLLKTETLSVKRKEVYDETQSLPSDYLYYKRITPLVSDGTCENVRIRSFLREEANVDTLLHLPSLEFEETFNTVVGNKVRVYHNGAFQVQKVELTYYRKPKQYDFKKLSQVVEFKDDVCELIVDEACKILASDIESFNQKGAAQERTEFDN